jgi:pyruvate-formate lyase
MEGESVRSMGGFDRLYYRFYRSDLARGLYTREQEKELIKFFFIKFYAKTGGLLYGKNFVFGGLDVDGNDATNPLSYAAFEAYQEMQTVDPKLSIRVHKDTPADFLNLVANSIRKGCNSIVLANDDIGVASMVRRGVPEREARDYVLMGCYEPAIVGKEVPCSGSIWVNIAKAFEWALHNGVDPLTGKVMGPQTGEPDAFTSFEEFYAAFETQLRHMLHEVMDIQVNYESAWKEMNTSPLLSGTMLECVDRGRDISDGGAKYNNTGCCLASIASTVDGLLALRELVFEAKSMTMSEVAEMLKSDWASHELLRLKMTNRREKYGNNREVPDALACDIFAFAADIINSTRNQRGGVFTAGINSIDHCLEFGRGTGAMPDGRKAHQPLSKNLSAVTGMDREGVTALINSVAKIDFTQFPDGSVLDIMLHPTAVQGEDGLVALLGLIRGYFAQGGFGVQFNIFDVDTLRAAQQRPEDFPTLQVRVCGWNVYFVNLSKPEQDMFIAQAEHLSA